MNNGSYNSIVVMMDNLSVLIAIQRVYMIRQKNRSIIKRKHKVLQTLIGKCIEIIFLIVIDFAYYTSKIQKANIMVTEENTE